jgi:hypothetical protein
MIRFHVPAVDLGKAKSMGMRLSLKATVAYCIHELGNAGRDAETSDLQWRLAYFLLWAPVHDQGGIQLWQYERPKASEKEKLDRLSGNFDTSHIACEAHEAF